VLNILTKKIQAKINTDYYLFIYGFKFPEYKVINNPQLASTESFLQTLKPSVQHKLDFFQFVNQNSNEFVFEAFLGNTITHRKSVSLWDTSMNLNTLRTLGLESKSTFRGMYSDYQLSFGSTIGFDSDSLLQVILPDEYFDDFVFDQREYKYFERVYPQNKSGFKVSQNCDFFFDNGQISQRESLQCRFDLGSRSYLIFGFNSASISGVNQKDFLTTELNANFREFLNSSKCFSSF
jgi:hypothetical protein